MIQDGLISCSDWRSDEKGVPSDFINIAITYGGRMALIAVEPKCRISLDPLLVQEIIRQSEAASETKPLHNLLIDEKHSDDILLKHLKYLINNGSIRGVIHQEEPLVFTIYDCPIQPSTSEGEKKSLFRRIFSASEQSTKKPPMENISTSLLSRAADVIADTNTGLSGPKIVTYCNAAAIDHNITIPHASYPFRAGNKRTALFENLRAFPAEIQFKLLMELCDEPNFAENDAVKKVQALIKERHSHLGARDQNTVPPWLQIPSSLPVAEFLPSPAQATPPTQVRPYDVFLSYSHADEAWMNLVKEHLVIFDRLKKIRKWWDGKLTPGAHLDNSIKKELASSDIILLFVSSSFIASNYCYEVEMTQALAQHNAGRSVVVPIIVRDCHWRSAPFGDLLALPQNGRPLATWPDKDTGAKNIAEGIMRLVAELQGKKT
jgi:hypothetical protein